MDRYVPSKSQTAHNPLNSNGHAAFGITKRMDINLKYFQKYSNAGDQFSRVVAER